MSVSPLRIGKPLPDIFLRLFQFHGTNFGTGIERQMLEKVKSIKVDSVEKIQNRKVVQFGATLSRTDDAEAE